MNGQGLLIQALVYLTAGVVSVPIAKRIGLGSVLGYLIAGVIVGPFLLDLVGEPADVMKFAEFGVVILLFLIGLEVRPALLWRMRTAIFGLGGGQMAGTTLAMAAAGLALGLDWRTALAAGAVLALSSTAIVLANLEEKGLRQGTLGEAVFGVLLFQDLAVIPLFALLPLLAVTAPVHEAAAAAGHGASLLDAMGLPGWAKALAILGAVAAVIGGGRYLVRPVFRFIAQARLREIFTATALLLVVAVAALMQTVGLSPALGAFLAGVVLAESEFRRELETDIEPFRGLLLGLFFITVGAGLDFSVIARQPALLIALVIGMMVLKAVAMFGVGALFRMPRREAGATAVSLAQGGEFAFVLLGFTVAAGVIDPQLSKLLSAVVALSMAFTPLAFLAYEKLVLSREAGPGAEPEHIPYDEGEPEVIVAGFGRFGQIAARLLIANDFNVVTLDSSIEQIELLRAFGRKVHYGDASRMDLLRTAGAEKARLLIVAIDDKDKAVELVEAAKLAFPNLTILSRAWDRRHAYDLLAHGADDVERESFEGSLAMGKRALMRLGFSERRAVGAAAAFRKLDRKLFETLAPAYGQEENYVLASRDSTETMERLLNAEMRRVGAEEEVNDELPFPARRVEKDRQPV
ncbi:MAG: monovalent cation:proton antiporter-2 (CPA2) family protein [Phenylobacterium sp.]|uniref:monovalent cation:proton antiporter-2 (CPA2) family protein n=1 Tax=Phenylobacterium sp. TaxID=1871053 RepID=UPI0027167FA7|nr:monovalent cation:proton antiporter-2 (CPA2) family protein [Phenylobacterium sp.]MDO8911017.1 monovalent cation:proton antiporter-2 (CPA2) family protein [Phenylobacterium sp.]MDP2011753.1 monovalent cation:proton antiporter-2 (CPA2) family protein [Phenylobacterium sp.]MDP3099348.1 monovalent cation:proton antiporter-2 (CPA2) family protein [Phenylobacterium sp.]MDP3633987.1 monovalent cation:proton antiporter-2 (CPA2) family protein [Phenylobacterium sp.]